MTDIRVLLIAVRGADREQFCAALPPELRAGVRETGGWVWAVAASASVDLAAIEDALAALPGTKLLLEARESQTWRLRAEATGHEPLEWLYPFWLVRLTRSELELWEARSGAAEAAEWIASELEGAGGGATARMFAAIPGRRLAERVRRFAERQSEWLVRHLMLREVPLVADDVRVVLLAKEPLPGETLSEIGNLPRVALALGFTDVFPDWVELQRQAVAEEEARFVPRDAEPSDDAEVEEDDDWEDGELDELPTSLAGGMPHLEAAEPDPFAEGPGWRAYRVIPEALPGDERIRLAVTAEDMADAGLERLGEYVRSDLAVVISAWADPSAPVCAIALIPPLSSAIRTECYTPLEGGRWLVSTTRPVEPDTPREEIEVRYRPKASPAQLLRGHRKRLRELEATGLPPLAFPKTLAEAARLLEDAAGAFSA